MALSERAAIPIHRMIIIISIITFALNSLSAMTFSYDARKLDVSANFFETLEKHSVVNYVNKMEVQEAVCTFRGGCRQVE